MSPDVPGVCVCVCVCEDVGGCEGGFLPTWDSTHLLKHILGGVVFQNTDASRVRSDHYVVYVASIKVRIK